MVKVVKGSTKEDHRNIFLNLAVPSMLAGEPGDLQKIDLVEGLTVTLWDRWEIKDAKDMTVEQLIASLESKYSGLEVRDIMRGGQPILFYAIMSAASKEAERKQIMESKVFKLCDADPDEEYIDLNITCVAKGQDKILEGIPPVRIYH